jgi:hypothetical protein
MLLEKNNNAVAWDCHKLGLYKDPVEMRLDLLDVCCNLASEERLWKQQRHVRAVGYQH